MSCDHLLELLAGDYFREGPPTGGPWTLPQTVYKYSAIAYDIATAIKAIQPSESPLPITMEGGVVWFEFDCASFQPNRWLRVSVCLTGGGGACGRVVLCVG